MTDMVTCENTSCPWWDEDGCLFCEEWEEGEYMNRPEEEEDERFNQPQGGDR